MFTQVIKYCAIPILLFCSCLHDKEEKVMKVPVTVEQLGELLFHDSILSRENQISCASCHKPQFAFADNVAFSFGVDSVIGGRNTPSSMNMSARNFYFHDGRSETLEDQAGGPMENPVEMDIPLSVVVRKLNKHKQYRAFFISIFGEPATKENLVSALAAYERTLETNDSAFDNYNNDKDTTQYTASAKRGQFIFNEKGKCFDCHFGPDFTNDDFKNIGLFNGKNLNDSGRFEITRDPEDVGRFKVPGLRNIAITKPYMHNGMFKSLKEVIDYYNDPDKVISNSVNRDTSMARPLGLTEKEKNDLEAFLMSLTDARFLKN
ncbi:MAG: cytochrome c peroxidase [Bacteroidota bacterium]